MLNVKNGTPFIGYAQLTNGAPGPTTFSLFVTMGQVAAAMPVGMKPYIVNITLSSNDATPALVTLDSGGTTPTKFVSAYMSVSQALQPEEIPPGICRGRPGFMPRVTATAVSGVSTVECVIQGYLSAE